MLLKNILVMDKKHSTKLIQHRTVMRRGFKNEFYFAG